ncbi:MAG TPA: DUF4105 domain-containing protein [Polyangiaceae bacterium]|nr:DUF4105 domain-containing protein [Polyangiaceae bacterium]
MSRHGFVTLPRRTITVVVAALFMAVLATWSPPARAEPGDELDVSVLIFGPGDHPFTKFGHDGLLVEDRMKGTSLVYNYGTYSFHSAWLIPKFLLGKYRYWLSVSPLSAVIASYALDNRSVVAQRLALSAAQKRTLADHLAWNALEENKYYLFDYYRDNCATRVRDLIDGTTDGAVHAATNSPAALSWREHTERLTADDLLVYLGLDLAMGGFIDQPISFWQEMFLPAKLQEGLARTKIGAVDAGGSTDIINLVDAETVLVTARRPPLRAAPPDFTRTFFGAGSVIALLLTIAGAAAYGGFRAARAALGIAVAALGVVLGCLGCLFSFLWIFTNHEVAYRNENILQCAPFALVLAWHGAALVWGRPRSAARAHRIALFGVACSALGLTLKVLPWFAQHNGYLIAFFLPLWIGLALATKIAAWRADERASRDGHRLAVAEGRRVEGT